MTQNKYKIRYLPSFDDELDKIIYYIAYNLKNKQAAIQLLDNINMAIENRSINPKGFEIYKSDKDRKYIWYRIYVKNFIIFYTVRNNIMEVAHILYGKRDLNNLV